MTIFLLVCLLSQQHFPQSTPHLHFVLFEKTNSYQVRMTDSGEKWAWWDFLLRDTLDTECCSPPIYSRYLVFYWNRYRRDSKWSHELVHFNLKEEIFNWLKPLSMLILQSLMVETTFFSFGKSAAIQWAKVWQRVETN